MNFVYKLCLNILNCTGQNKASQWEKKITEKKFECFQKQYKFSWVKNLKIIIKKTHILFRESTENSEIKNRRYQTCRIQFKISQQKKNKEKMSVFKRKKYFTSTMIWTKC